jgi:hypothetical protein
MQRSRCPGKRVPGLALGTDDVPVPAPDNGPADSAVDAVRLALMAVSRKRPGGKVAEADELTGPAQWTAWTITAVLPCCRAAGTHPRPARHHGRGAGLARAAQAGRDGAAQTVPGWLLVWERRWICVASGLLYC